VAEFGFCLCTWHRIINYLNKNQKKNQLNKINSKLISKTIAMTFFIFISINFHSVFNNRKIESFSLYNILRGGTFDV
jgi:hypothetical protein